jgi:hypothetical protein
MKNQLKFALTAAVLTVAPLASAETEDCVRLSQSVRTAVSADTSRVLEIVASSVAKNQSCVCEVVKAAIIGSDADARLVGQIVETAVLEAPSDLRIIAQCAIATAPEAAGSVQGVVEKYAAAGGDGYSAKGGLDDSKGAIEDAPDPVTLGNPLDYPFQNINSPGFGSPAEATVGAPGATANRFAPVFFFPPIEDDPNVTAPLSSTGSPMGEPGHENGFDSPSGE